MRAGDTLSRRAAAFFQISRSSMLSTEILTSVSTAGDFDIRYPGSMEPPTRSASPGHSARGG